MTASEWEIDFKSFIGELQMPRDDCKGIMAYIEDGAKLMKAQEPRVLTLEEVPKYDGAFLIEYRHEVWPMQWTLFRLELTMAYRFIRADYELGFSLAKDLYGRTWRCWTSRPTNEQREAAPWGT